MKCREIENDLNEMRDPPRKLKEILEKGNGTIKLGL